MKSLWEKLAYCAEVDAGLPGSLICDAWDLIEQVAVEQRDHWTAYRLTFETALLQAVDAYLASPVTYDFNPRVR